MSAAFRDELSNKHSQAAFGDSDPTGLLHWFSKHQGEINELDERILHEWVDMATKVICDAGPAAKEKLAEYLLGLKALS